MNPRRSGKLTNATASTTRQVLHTCASIHHGIDAATRDRSLIDHRALLFYLPAYSPELNKIEIVWRQLKYRWRYFVTWTTETIDAELAELLRGYGSAFQTDFS
ncbi:transposase [Burkholderia ubonensis]|uniref:transposase n=1 Tax=Burkholderia ubonensis TaxID=101571 RepID=UPI0012FAAE0C